MSTDELLNSLAIQIYKSLLLKRREYLRSVPEPFRIPVLIIDLGIEVCMTASSASWKTPPASTS